MNKRPKKELIDGIRDSLRNFEETYDHREWEHFQRQRKNKRRRPVILFLKLTGIAASLFLIAYAAVNILPILEDTNNDGSGRNVPKAAPYPVPEKEPERPDTLVMDSVTHSADPAAPVLAIPVGKLSNDEYRWLHGGVSVRLYFR